MTAQPSPNLKAVTFDCAQTLVAVDWRPAMLAVECAQDIGLEFDEVQAASDYDSLLRRSWSEFKVLNLQRDSTVTDAFWFKLSTDWAIKCDFPVERVPDLIEAGESKLFGPNSTVFSLYDDVVPCLEALRNRGLKLGVVSNWDISLHKTLKTFDLTKYFDVVTASMEEGIEKPDPRLFLITLEKLGVLPGETVHVGDNPIDDLMGAKSAGIPAFVIDRLQPPTGRVYIQRLTDLLERLFP